MPRLSIAAIWPIDYLDYVDEHGVQHWETIIARVELITGPAPRYTATTQKGPRPIQARTGVVCIDGARWAVTENACHGRWVVTGPAENVTGE